jgi:probable HAF family extracellular repeat protein
VPGSLQTRATDINNAGQIVGYYQNPSTPSGRSTGFIISNGTRSDIPIQEPWGINNAGAVVGYSFIDGAVRGQIYSNGVLTQVAMPGAFNTQLLGINDLGVAVGTYGTEQNPYAGIFTYFDGAFVDIGIVGVGYRIESDGRIFGVSGDYPGGGGFNRAQDGSVTKINYTYNNTVMPAYLYGMNSTGDIVGYAEFSGGVSKAFVYNAGVFYNLDYPLTSQTNAFGINDSGYVVGGWWDSGQNIGHGFLATPCTDASCQNNPSGSVPLPQTLALLGLGLVGVGAFQRKLS